MKDFSSTDSTAQKRNRDKLRQRKSRAHQRVEQIWENAGYHKLSDDERVKQETGEVLYDIAEEQGLGGPGEAIDLLVDAYNSDQKYSRAVAEKSSSPVTRDNRKRRQVIYSINQEAARRLL